MERYPREGLEQVGGHSRRPGTGRGDPQGGPGRDGGPSWMPEMGRKMFGVVRDWLGDTQGGLGRVGGSSVWSGTGRGTLVEVLDGKGDPR